MKRIIPFVFAAVLFAGCNLLGNNSHENRPLTPVFTLSDTTGHKTTTFHSGKRFIMSFSLINTTSDTLKYFRGSSEPAVIFKILEDDSVVATSIDGYVFLAVVLRGSLAPGDTLQGQWEAPNTPAQHPRVVLSPGSYEAGIFFAHFERTEIDSLLNSLPPIKFTVVP